MLQIKTKVMSLKEAQKLGIDSWTKWECEPKTFEVNFGVQEVIYVFEGDLTVTAGDEVVTIKENMIAIFPKGLKCTWQINKHIKKVYTNDFEISLD